MLLAEPPQAEKSSDCGRQNLDGLTSTEEKTLRFVVKVVAL